MARRKHEPKDTEPKAKDNIWHQWDMPIYSREVSEVCMNCKRTECTEVHGCEAFKAKMREVRQKMKGVGT